MTPAQLISREVVNGTVYLTTEYRGTEYTLRRGAWGWELSTRRMNYGGRFHIGGFKRFESFADVQSKCKAFAAVELVGAL
jgi:hypothetical protein